MHQCPRKRTNIISLVQYIFPLVFLILRHHSRIISLASRVVLDRDELNTAANSIQEILNVVLERIGVLNGNSAS